MMLEHLGWHDAGNLITKGLAAAIQKKQVTYDLARLMEGATELKTSQFADAVIANM
jgi:isocitrate dehydrogenase